MRILDRYIIRSFLLNYLLALVVLVGMYVLLDLIVNFNRFNKGATLAGESSALAIAMDILDYYGYQTLVIFAQVSGVVPLLASGFTMVRMTRHNELTAMLASGVSLYRVAAPIVIVSIILGAAAIVDQEVLMPRFQDKLLRKHDEVNRVVTDRSSPVYFVPDKNNLVFASDYDKEKKALKDVRIFERADDATVLRRSMANTGTWVSAAEMTGMAAAGGGGGKWVLEGDARLIDEKKALEMDTRAAVRNPTLEYTTGLEPRHIELQLSKRAVDFLSSGEIQSLIINSPPRARVSLEKMLHTRFTQPIMNIVMLLLGIPFLLTREPARLIKNMFYCAIVSGICFALTFVCFQLGGVTLAQGLPVVGGMTFSPLLAAWLPVLIFGPISLVALDMIRT